jgi:hypothetical protein
MASRGLEARYEVQVTEWRRQSADVRTRPESERAQWKKCCVRERGEQQDGAAVTGRREVPAHADTSIKCEHERVGCRVTAEREQRASIL